MKYKPPPEVIVDPDCNETHFPEKNLWLAVVDRAIKDYCGFFDKLFMVGFNHGKFLNVVARVESNLSIIQATHELNRLRWFLFEESPEPFNMQYIMECLYEDHENMLSSMRAAITKRFNDHIDAIEKLGQFPRLVHYIKNETTALIEGSLRREQAVKRRKYQIN
jgi:hypothetical protein